VGRETQKKGNIISIAILFMNSALFIRKTSKLFSLAEMDWPILFQNAVRFPQAWRNILIFWKFFCVEFR
jgi:hypothetical protein